jgi:phospholipid/cholesterol/gamma-HCH transport system ATP-binding protein
MSASPIVQFEKVSKSFAGHQVLIDVSLPIAEGEALCILGRSGTGKSVTLKLMIGLIKPDSGSICIQGEDIVPLKEKELSEVRRNMGFLFQGAALFDSFTVGRNLSLPLTRFEKSKSPAEVQQAVADALHSVGLENEQNKMPSELSGGMQKRAALARAMILKPKLLLVDEPSSGLDRITAAEIDDLLLKVKTERCTTLVIVTHDVHGARRVADKAAVLDQGRLVGFGTMDELSKSENQLVRRLTSEVEA